MADPIAVVERDPRDVSPKVTTPAILTALAAVIAGAVSLAQGDGIVDPVAFALALTAVVQYVIGYLRRDTIKLPADVVGERGNVVEVLP